MYHFDGKVERGSARKNGEIKPLNVLNVFSSRYGICIEQEMIEEKTNEITAIPKVIEKRYYISSLLRDITTFSEAIRGHWKVENKLHWQMDYTFKCDKNQTVNKKVLFNLQIIKKFALNILNLVKEDYKRSLKKIRFFVSLRAEEEIHNIFYLLHKKKQIF